MTCCLVSCLLLVPASAEPATFLQRWNRSEDLYELSSGSAQEVSRAKALLRAILRDAADEDEALYARWRLACWEFRVGDPGRACAMLEKALRAAPEGNFITFRIHWDLGDFYAEAWQSDLAEKHVNKALELARRKRLPFKGQCIAVGDVQLLALEIRKAEFRTFHTQDRHTAHDTFSSLRNKIELVINRSIKDKRGPGLAWVLLAAKCDVNLADCERHMSQPFRAIARLKRCLEYLRRYQKYYSAVQLQFGCHLSLATNNCSLTRFAEGRDELDTASKLLPRIANGRNRGDLENAQAFARIEESRFLLIQSEGADAKILSLLEEAEKHCRAALGCYAPEANNPLAYIAMHLGLIEELRAQVLERQGASRKSLLGQYRSALTNTRDALQRLRKTLPPDEDIVLQVRRRLAGLYLKLDQLSNARKEAEDAFELYRKRHPEVDQDILGRGLLLQTLMELEDCDGQSAKAARYAEAHRRLSAQHLVTYLSGMTGPEQIHFFRQWDDPGFQDGLRLGIKYKKYKALREASAEWLINGKGRVTAALAQVHQYRLGDKARADFLKAVQQQAYILYAHPKEEPTRGVREQFLALEMKKRELGAARAALFRKAGHWYDLKELRKTLSPDKLYVGIYDLSLKENEPRAYYAWIVPAQGPVEVVCLGDAARIDTLAKQFQEHQERFPILRKKLGDRIAEKELRRDCLAPLSRLVLDKICKYAHGSKYWVVSPDGPLWNVPWAALLLPDGRYAIEDITFRYAISGQDLIGRKPPPMPAGPSLVIADPSYDKVPSGKTWPLPNAFSQLRALPFARQEARTVAKGLKKLYGQEVQVFLEDKATKAALLQTARSPRVVYLSTHGFFNLPTKGQADDPLLRCGIAFAGWNHLPADKGGKGAVVPGLLTGAEVLSADLRGTELVVLGSCESGIGKREYGQSPADLRLAFHLAGARAVVSSLWNVETEATRALMVYFFDSSRFTADKAVALQEAQRQAIRVWSKYRRHAHPFFWAAFTISGS
jgi:CHAT domain-containing protein